MEFPAARYHGIPQSTTPNALIAACVEFCSLGTYLFEEENGKKGFGKKNPNNCVVLCSGCDSICAAGAFKHPSKKEFRENIKAFRENPDLKLRKRSK